MNDYEKILMFINAKQEFGVGNPYTNEFVTNENLAKFLVENGVIVKANLSLREYNRLAKQKERAKKKYIGEEQ